MLRCERLDRCLRANRYEDRGKQVTMRRGEHSRAGAVVFCGDSELKHWDDYNLADSLAVSKASFEECTHSPTASGRSGISQAG